MIGTLEQPKEHAKDQPKKDEPRFRPPVVEVGQTVHWFPSMTPNSGDVPTAAVVVCVGIDTVDLHIHQPYSNSVIFRAGTRHVSDPRCARFLDSVGGTWDHTAFTKKVQELLS